MNSECPYYIPPTMGYCAELDEFIEGSAMCELVDKYCLVEYGERCETYQEFLKEEE